MRKTEIFCDSCNYDLTETDAMPKFRLVVGCEALPHKGNFINAVAVHPPLNGTHHFCGIKCLENFLKDRKEKLDD